MRGKVGWGDGSRARLFLVDELPDGPFAVLDGAEGRHAAAVARLRVGEPIQLGDGRGGLVRGEVVAVERDRLRLAVQDRTVSPAPQPRIVVAQALVKGDRGELAVELATEAGVDGIVPWRAARCVARWELGPRGDRALGRWRATARAASKQARRPFVPVVEGPASTADLCHRVAAAAGALVLHEAASDTLAALGPTLPRSGELFLVVGPEGGVNDDELAGLSAAGARPVRLGPEVLRASTAAAVALGALGVLAGRWVSIPAAAADVER